MIYSTELFKDVPHYGSYYEWKGVGYVVLDPTTGVGAYMISGGLAGASLSLLVPLSLRIKSIYTAWITAATCTMVVIEAILYLNTIYVYGAETPRCGFDCSGFIHYLFTTVYGEDVLGGKRRTATGQHTYLVSKGWTFPYAERLPGDILWKAGFKHTGIDVFTSFIPGTDLIINASGYPCPNQDDPSGRVPSPECQVHGPATEGRQRICGDYKEVVVSIASEFADNGSIHPEIGRPTLWVIAPDACKD